MDEVDLRGEGKAVEGGVGGGLKRIPADVGEDLMAEAANDAGEEGEAAAGGLFGGVEEGLHADADGEAGGAGGEAVAEGVADGGEFFGDGSEGADAGEDDDGGLEEVAGIFCDGDGEAGGLEGLGETVDIADAVVEEGGAGRHRWEYRGAESEAQAGGGGLAAAAKMRYTRAPIQDAAVADTRKIPLPASKPTTPDPELVEIAQRIGFLSEERVAEARRLHEMLVESNVASALEDVVSKKYLTPEQVRILTVYMNYELMRREDQSFAESLVDLRMLKPEQKDECLKFQEGFYLRGARFPRLSDLLLEKGYVSAPSLQRAKEMWGQGDESPKPKAAAPVASAKAFEPAEGGGDNVKLIPRKLPPDSDNPEILPILVIKLQGQLDGHNFTSVDEYLTELIDNRYKRLIINCEKLDYVSSGGIGALGGVARKAREDGGDVRLCSLQDKIMKVFKMIGLEKMVRCYGQETGAIASFKYV